MENNVTILVEQSKTSRVLKLLKRRTKQILEGDDDVCNFIFGEQRSLRRCSLSCVCTKLLINMTKLVRLHDPVFTKLLQLSGFSGTWSEGYESNKNKHESTLYSYRCEGGDHATEECLPPEFITPETRDLLQGKEEAPNRCTERRTDTCTCTCSQEVSPENILISNQPDQVNNQSKLVI